MQALKGDSFIAYLFFTNFSLLNISFFFFFLKNAVIISNLHFNKFYCNSFKIFRGREITPKFRWFVCVCVKESKKLPNIHLDVD